MIIKKNIAFLFSLIITVIHAQDVHFSQFYESPLLLNPSFAGSSNADFRAVLNYRDQWRSVINPYKTGSLALDGKIPSGQSKKSNFIGLGLSVFNDRVGVLRLNTNLLHFHLSYILTISKNNRIAVGINTGFFQMNINPNGLRWDKQYNGKYYDPGLPTGENFLYQNIIRFDIGTGLSFHHQNKPKGINYQAGISMGHINRPLNSFTGSKSNYHFKYALFNYFNYRPENNSIMWVFSSLFTQQGSHREFIVGGNLKYFLSEQSRENVILNTFAFYSSSIQIGIYHRIKDAIIFNFAYEHKRNYQIGLSYDFNISKLISASRFRGGLEVTFLCKIFKKNTFISEQHDF